MLTAGKLTELVLLDRSGRSYSLTGDYERALELIRRDPSQEALYSYIDYLPILGQLGRKEEAREKWQKILGEDPSWTAESFVKWYKLWNIRDEDSAKFMEDIYKTGLLGAEACNPVSVLTGGGRATPPMRTAIRELPPCPQMALSGH